MATMTVSAQTADLLRHAVSRLVEPGHRLAAAEEREARERRDATARADEARYLRSREHLLDVQATARQYQARADDALQPWSLRAPAFVAGESLGDYRLRLARLAQRQLPEDDELRSLRLKTLPDDAYASLEPQIFAACKEAGNRPDSVAAGEMRQVERIDPANGQKVIEFLGQRSFIHDLKAPVRRVVGFRTDQGYVNTTGTFLR
jgi:hypothetical protein